MWGGGGEKHLSSPDWVTNEPDKGLCLLADWYTFHLISGANVRVYSQLNLVLTSASPG